MKFFKSSFRKQAVRSYEKESRISGSAEQVYAWHARPGAFQRLTPDWQGARMVESEEIRDGNKAVLEVSLGPFAKRWVARYGSCVPGRRFVDEQEKGPFSRWTHRHEFLPVNDLESRMLDHVNYAVSFGQDRGLWGNGIRRKIDRLFHFRHERLRNDFRRLAAASLQSQRILITGASGLVGRALSAFLSAAGHEVWDLVRRPPNLNRREIFWDYLNQRVNREDLEGFDAVIHLAGEGIAAGRWNPRRKAAIRRSRVEGTRFLAQTLAGLRRAPKTLLCASAIGFYGDRAGEEVSEKSPRGNGFLPEVCFEWEDAVRAAQTAGIRVAQVRTGIVLNSGGGALPQMLLPFQMGLGGVIGKGNQWMSWISLEDLVGVYYFLLCREDLSGPFNATAPGAVTNLNFTKALGQILRRPTRFPLPAFAVNVLLGEMGERLLLEGQKVKPARLHEEGYEFFYPELEPALRFELGRFQ
ncbi:MAG: TIGR01777 family oxidoreductase [bacterium]